MAGDLLKKCIDHNKVKLYSKLDVSHSTVIMCCTTMHTNEAIWLVLERARLEYRSRWRHATDKQQDTTFFNILTIYSLPFLTLFARNMEENITEIHGICWHGILMIV